MPLNKKRDKKERRLERTRQEHFFGHIQLLNGFHVIIIVALFPKGADNCTQVKLALSSISSENLNQWSVNKFILIISSGLREDAAFIMFIIFNFINTFVYLRGNDNI